METPPKATAATPGKRNRKAFGISMSLPWAEFISFWSNWILIGALVIGLVATYGIVVSGNVKEAAANKEIARLSSEAEASRAAVADANARALEAGQKAEEEKLERVKIEQEMLKQLRPRGFTKEQFDGFVSSVKGNIKELTVYTLTEDEASQFGYAIMDALQKADVKVNWMRQVVPTDLFMVMGIPTTGVILYMPQVGDNPEKKKLVEAFLDAAQKGGITGALAASPENPIPGVPVPSLFIAKQQRPFTWFPEHLAPSGLPRPPWEPK